MKALGQFIKLLWVVIRYRFDRCVLGWFAPSFWLGWVLPRVNPDCGQRCVDACIAMGPFFIKMGQFLSVRTDVVPSKIADALATLQDRVPAFPGDQAVAMIEAEMGESIKDVFKRFTEKAVASASIAQVHAATLHTGEKVAVKLLRPGIHEAVAANLRMLKALASLLSRCSKMRRRFKPMEIYAEFDATLHYELDMQRESANASLLARNFADYEGMHVPSVHWDFVTANMTVFEYIDGVRIDKVDKLKKAKVDLKLLAERGVEIFFTQVFRDSFFHADMHPGNVFVDIKDPANPRYMAVDFGIMGDLMERDKRYLAANLLAFLNRDYAMIARLHVESGWISRDSCMKAFENDIRAVCEPMFARPISDISVAQVLLRLFKTAKRFQIEIQPQLMLLQKTLLNIEALGQKLYPELDLWAKAKPFLENWVKEQTGFSAWSQELKKQSVRWPFELPEIPSLLHEVLTDVRARQHQQDLPNQSTSRWGWWITGVATGVIVMHVISGVVI